MGILAKLAKLKDALESNPGKAPQKPSGSRPTSTTSSRSYSTSARPGSTGSTGNRSTSSRTLKIETFSAVGVVYYKEAIGKLATRNPDWKMNTKQAEAAGKVGKRIYRYSYINKPVRLVPEPKNPHDKDAVMVVIAGEKVGYISASENVHVKDILENHEIKYISGYVVGGEYKIYRGDGEIFRNNLGMTINVKIGYV